MPIVSTLLFGIAVTGDDIKPNDPVDADDTNEELDEEDDDDEEDAEAVVDADWLGIPDFMADNAFAKYLTSDKSAIFLVAFLTKLFVVAAGGGGCFEVTIVVVVTVLLTNAFLPVFAEELTVLLDTVVDFIESLLCC